MNKDAEAIGLLKHLHSIAPEVCDALGNVLSLASRTVAAEKERAELRAELAALKAAPPEKDSMAETYAADIALVEKAVYDDIAPWQAEGTAWERLKLALKGTAQPPAPRCWKIEGGRVEIYAGCWLTLTDITNVCCVEKGRWVRIYATRFSLGIDRPDDAEAAAAELRALVAQAKEARDVEN